MTRANEPMIDLYIQETKQLLDRLEQIIIECEKNGNLKEHINEIFRIMHTIKGNSMMMMYDGIAELAHCAEDIFDHYRQHTDIELEMTVLTDLMLDIMDFDKNQINQIEAGENCDPAPEGLIESLKEMFESVKFMTRSEGDKDKNPSGKENSVLKGNEIIEEALQTEDAKYFIAPVGDSSKSGATGSMGCFKVKINFQDGCEMENIRAFTIQHHFKNFCETLSTYPVNVVDDDQATDLIKKNGFHLVLKTAKTVEEVDLEVQGSAFVSEYDVKQITSEDYEQYLKEFQGGGRKENVSKSTPKVPEKEGEGPEIPEKAKAATTTGATSIGGNQTHT